MAPKKAPKPNAFALFAQDLFKQQGRKYNSMKDAFDAAGPLWARMSKDQRKPYEEQAKELKGTAQKLTSEGLDVDVLTREQQQKSMDEEHARQSTRMMLSRAHQNGVLDREVFFLIHCNIFCYYSKENRYWPAEIGVAALTLKDGVAAESIFHSMIAPGVLPIGYKFEAKQHSDETHLISIPTDDDAEDNQAEVYENLKAFIERNKPPGSKRVVLYTERKYVPVIQRILAVWMNDYEVDNVEPFKIYELQMMFYYLRNTVAGDAVWASISLADRELEKDIFAYVQELACPFHATSSQPVYCSQSTVLRYAHALCNNCCGDLGIQFILGKHVPINARIPDPSGSISTSSRRTSSKKSSRSTNSRRGFDSDFDTESNADTWDTESLASNASASTLTSNYDDGFPPLGASSYSDANSSTTRSYSGMTAKSSLPSAFEKSFGNISINSDRPKPMGRGFRPRKAGGDSDASSTVGASGSDSEFPRLGGGRGRGFIFKKAQTPGQPAQK